MPARLRPTHRRRPPALARQRGVALILLITVLVIGVVWYTVGALGKAAPTTADREVITGHALEQAKLALLGYVAQYAARSSTIEPGQMPCPESLNSIGASNQGQASSNCGNSTAVGRLPWETLGVDEIRDGYGEPIWYVLSPGFRSAPINFGTPGQLTYNGNLNAAVALLIAPGSALNTLSDPATPPAGCSKVNQQVSTRNTPSLNSANFLECGNDTGTANYAIPGPSEWTNDRVIAITQADWVQAIAGPVADRLQRQVTPALEDWRLSISPGWGASFLPYASTFSDPTTNDLCGDTNRREGLLPVAGTASATCPTLWTNGNVAQLAGVLNSPTCAQIGGAYQCSFSNLSSLPALKVRISADVPNIGTTFRNPLVGGPPDITDNRGGTVTNFSLSIATGGGNAGQATLQVDIQFPPFAFGATTVTIQNPSTAFFADSRMAWFINNDWARYTYYVLARGARLSSGNPCSGPGDPDCLILNGLPASNGNASDKQIILALMGPALSGQTRPSNNVNDYLESRSSGTVFNSAVVTSTYNDRLATCPFQQTPASGGPITICN